MEILTGLFLLGAGISHIIEVDATGVLLMLAGCTHFLHAWLEK